MNRVRAVFLFDSEGPAPNARRQRNRSAGVSPCLRATAEIDVDVACDSATTLQLRNHKAAGLAIMGADLCVDGRLTEV